MRAGAADRFVVTNRFPTLRINLVYGPALTDVLTRYTGLTGRPPLPPPWAFGPWISSDIWRSGGEVRYAATQFGDRGIPASVFVFDSPWEIAYNDFQWNMTQFGTDATIDGVHYPGFASPAEMMQFLQSNGLKVICWMTPFVNVSSDDENVAGQNLGQAANYADGAAKGAFVRQAPDGAPLVVPWWKGRGSPVDFTSTAGQPVAGRTSSDSSPPRSSVVTTFRRHRAGDRRVQDRRRRKRQRTQHLHTRHGRVTRTGGRAWRCGTATAWSITRRCGTSSEHPGSCFARSGFTGSQAFPGLLGRRQRAELR